ncbi:MAG TPA: response regulator [Bacteroidia bacterium]|nr:response regulator [Bacteroidia bacterium]
MSILIVDDEEMTLVALAKMLQEKDYKVISTLDGVEALKIVADKKIDLIISDIMMPCISGFTLLTMLKNFYFSKIPMILMSSYNEKSFIDKSHSLGAYTFIAKPINYEELFIKINELVP